MKSRNAPLPPAAMPGTCRWCEGPAPHGRCVVLDCVPEPRFTERCQDCDRDHQTGKRNAVLCWQCDRKDRRAHEAGYSAPTIGRGYRDLSVDFHRPKGAA